MKESKLRQIIKEEVKTPINETNKVYKLYEVYFEDPEYDEYICVGFLDEKMFQKKKREFKHLSIDTKTYSNVLLSPTDYKQLKNNGWIYL